MNKNIISIFIVVILGIAGGIYYLNNTDLKNELVNDSVVSVNSYTAESSPAEATGDEIRFILNPIETSQTNQKGIASLEEIEDKVRVIVAIDGSKPNVAQPAHIHTGACPTPGAVVYPLTDVVNGKSETILNVSLKEIKAQLPLAINIHKSAQEKEVYTACGNLE